MGKILNIFKKRKWHGLNAIELHSPIEQPLLIDYWAFEMWLVRTEMYCRYKIHTRFQRFSAKNAKHLINNIYFDYMGHDNILDTLG